MKRSIPHAWANDALLLIAHGASRHDDASRLVRAHAETLRQQGAFAEVAVGLLNGSPTPLEALAGVASPIVHVVPFFMEQGWFVREAVPRALQDAVGHALRFHAPVGLHADMALLAARRVQAAVGPGAAGHAVLLVGHGSARAPGRQMALHRHAAAIAAGGQFAQVSAAFLEEPPFVADLLAAWRAWPVAVLGFFAGEGGHVRDDLPQLIEAERAQRGDHGAAITDLGIIADDPAMPRIVLEQVACA